jgi:hypothetical protein
MKIHQPTAVGLVLLALALPLTRAGQEPAPGPALQRWDYKVVGLGELHGSTLDYLKGALTEDGGLLDKVKAADDQLARKTEDLLDELGAEGWELLHYSKTSLILMRPAQ